MADKHEESPRSLGDLASNLAHERAGEVKVFTAPDLGDSSTRGKAEPQSYTALVLLNRRRTTRQRPGAVEAVAVQLNYDLNPRALRRLAARLFFCTTQTQFTESELAAGESDHMIAQKLASIRLRTSASGVQVSLSALDGVDTILAAHASISQNKEGSAKLGDYNPRYDLDVKGDL